MNIYWSVYGKQAKRWMYGYDLYCGLSNVGLMVCAVPRRDWCLEKHQWAERLIEFRLLSSYFKLWSKTLYTFTIPTLIVALNQFFDSSSAPEPPVGGQVTHGISAGFGLGSSVRDLSALSWKEPVLLFLLHLTSIINSASGNTKRIWKSDKTNEVWPMKTCWKPNAQIHQSDLHSGWHGAWLSTFPLKPSRWDQYHPRSGGEPNSASLSLHVGLLAFVFAVWFSLSVLLFPLSYRLSRTMLLRTAAWATLNMETSQTVHQSYVTQLWGIPHSEKSPVAEDPFWTIYYPFNTRDWVLASCLYTSFEWNYRNQGCITNRGGLLLPFSKLRRQPDLNQIAEHWDILVFFKIDFFLNCSAINKKLYSCHCKYLAFIIYCLFLFISNPVAATW